MTLLEPYLKEAFEEKIRLGFAHRQMINYEKCSIVTESTYSNMFFVSLKLAAADTLLVFKKKMFLLFL